MAPQAFMKCLAPVVAYLRLHSITVFPYLDDWLLVAPTQAQLNTDTSFTLSLLSALGLQVNSGKSTLQPAQRVSYISAVLDASVGRAFLPEYHILKIEEMVALFLPDTRASVLQVQRLLGLMVSTTSVLQHARLKMQSLQAWFLSLCNPLLIPPSKLLSVSVELAVQLSW